MDRSAAANYPDWPTVEWTVGEIRLYLLAILISGGGFLLAAGLIYSAVWAIFVVGLLVGAAAMLFLTLKNRRHAFSWAMYLTSMQQPSKNDGANDLFARQQSEDTSGIDEIRDELQKLLESATRIAAENEALRSDIAQLRQRALRRRPGGTL